MEEQPRASPFDFSLFQLPDAYDLSIFRIMKTICYCFDYSDADIINDILKNRGRSLIEERITKAKKSGTCQCDIKNPKKR